MGYILVFLSLLSYGALGICHKLGERTHCRPKLLAMMLFIFAAAGMNGVVFLSDARYMVPRNVAVLAVICGVVGLAAIWAFQIGIEYGKIATSWLIINLSSVIPTVGSIVLYREPINPRKILSILLIFGAIVLVWKDGLEDMRRAENELKEHPAVGAPRYRR
ncbi:MAG: EamA family transporter [Acidobacteriaceae bacterium]